MGVLEEIVACEVEESSTDLVDGTSGYDGEEAEHKAYNRTADAIAHGKGRWRDLLFWKVLCVDSEIAPEPLRRELIYVARVCIDWIEALDRRTGRK